jgi:hypothetical protein
MQCSENEGFAEASVCHAIFYLLIILIDDLHFHPSLHLMQSEVSLDDLY